MGNESAATEWLIRFDASTEDEAKDISAAIDSDPQIKVIEVLERNAKGANLLNVSMTPEHATALMERLKTRAQIIPNTRLPDPRFVPPSPFE